MKTTHTDFAPQMKTSHTPAPWSPVQNYGMGEPIKLTNPTSIAMNGCGGAYVTSLGCSAGEMAANASLIAAAPDLLSACQAALALLQDGDAEPCDADRVTAILVAAIDRATRN